MRGAWMWPTFAVLGIVDGIVGHALPVAGDSQSVLGGIVVGLVLNLMCVALLSRPVGMLLRVRRRDLPTAIARNYAGTACVVLVTLGFFALGLAHRPSITGDRASMRDAITRAAAYIGDHAPAAFRVNASRTDTFAIQSGSVYRTCVPDDAGTRFYCVIVNERQPPDRSVRPGGSEPNATMMRGVN